MIDSTQVRSFLRQLHDDVRPSNQDILEQMAQQFIRHVEVDSDLKVYRIFGGYLVRRRLFSVPVGGRRIR